MRYEDLWPEPPKRGPLELVVGSGETDSYGRAALERECLEVAEAGEGSRNDALNRAWYRMARIVAAGRLDATDARTSLRAAGLASGLPPAEVDVVLRTGPGSALEAAASNPRAIDPLTPLPDLTTLPLLPPAPTGEDEETPRTSWYPRDLTDHLNGTEVAPQPTALARQDGKCLLYPGRVNALLGESESGKSWVALHGVAQELRHGHPVLFLDFEDSPSSVVARLRSLGVSTQEFSGLTYVDPSEGFTPAARADLAATLEEHPPTFVVVDGVNAAMTVLGLDLLDNADATRFHTTFLKPLARTGATVLTVDHLPKSKENRGKGGIGAQAKRAMIDGAAYTVEVLEPFGRGQTGRLRIHVDKDRLGTVRGFASGATLVGFAVLHSHDDTVDFTIEPPDADLAAAAAERDPWRVSLMMERISRLLEELPEGLSPTGIEKTIAGRSDKKREALQNLRDGGWVGVRKRVGSGGGMTAFLIKRYRETWPEEGE